MSCDTIKEGLLCGSENKATAKSCPRGSLTSESVCNCIRVSVRGHCDCPSRRIRSVWGLHGDIVNREV